MDFLFFDHKFYKTGELNLSYLLLKNNFQLDQSIWYRNNELPLFSENIMLLHQKAGFFKLEWPEFMEDQHELLRLIKRLLNKNRFYKTGRVVLKLIWDVSGMHYLIQAMPSEEKYFLLADKGLLMNFSEVLKLPDNQFAAYDIFNRLYWDHAVSNLKGTSAGNSIILNKEGSVCEAIGANIFFFKGKSIITPSPETGCYIDTIRRKILEAAIGINYQVIESRRISREQVFGMDEVFIASEAKGMEWVIGIESKRYIHSRSYEVNKKLNELLIESVQ